MVPKPRSTNNTYTDTMHLLHYKYHFMFISDITTASHSFACHKCHKLWKVYWDMQRHEKICNGGKKNMFIPMEPTTQPLLFGKLLVLMA